MLAIENNQGAFLEVVAERRLQRSDYDRLLPQIERSIDEYGKVRMLVILRDFEGWTPQALFEDLKFEFRHRKHFEKVAVVGDKTWERVATRLGAVFYEGEVQFFADEAAARAWIEAPPYP